MEAVAQFNAAEMSMGHKLRLTVLSIVLLLAISPNRGVACMMTFAQHRVGTSFVVEISYNGRPLRGVETEVSRVTHKEPYLVVLLSTKSDQDGESAINGLAPGDYFLVVKHAGIDGEAVELKVVGEEQRDAFVEDRLKLSWPNKKVFKVRQVAGTLIRTPFDNTEHSVEPALAGAKLTLTDALPATQRGVSVVQPDGRFAFADLDAGLYIVHVTQGKGTQPFGEEGIDGNIFVEVARNAADQEIPVLRVYMSDCGIGIRGKDGNEIF